MHQRGALMPISSHTITKFIQLTDVPWKIGYDEVASTTHERPTVQLISVWCYQPNWRASVTAAESASQQWCSGLRAKLNRSRVGMAACRTAVFQRVARPCLGPKRSRNLRPFASAGSETAYKPTSATDAVETGTKLFQEKKYGDALRLYEEAMQMSPNEDEARAAKYNAACVHAQRKEWQEAVDCLKEAVNTYKLKANVILEDKDLRPLRERREWLDAQDDLRGLVKSSARRSLRAEAKTPFRFARSVIFGALGVSASVALLITLTRLIAILAGPGDKADLPGTVQNFAIDLAGAVFFGFLVSRDLKAKSKAEAVVEREDSLGRLQVDLGKGRVLPLSRLRGAVRPLVVAGSKGYVGKVLRDAKRFKADLRERGVSLVPVVMSDADPESEIAALKRDPAFRRAGKDGGKGFSGAAPAEAASAGGAAVSVTEADRKWELKAHDVKEWAAWLEAAMDEKSLSERNIYIQVQLDGSVRASGNGVPPFPRFIGDIPTLDSIRTGFTDGVGPQDD
eukprot:jgi/Ulvmu1/10799/UM069_0034.1